MLKIILQEYCSREETLTILYHHPWNVLLPSNCIRVKSGNSIKPVCTGDIHTRKIPRSTLKCKC